MKKYIVLALLSIVLIPKNSTATLGDFVAAPIGFAADVTADAVDTGVAIGAGAVGTGVGLAAGAVEAGVDIAEGAVDTAADIVAAPFEYPIEYDYDNYEYYGDEYPGEVVYE